MVEEAYTGEDLFFSLFGVTGLEGRDRDLAGAGGDPTGIAYSAYTYDPQGNLVQPVTLYPGRAVASMVRVDTSSSYDAFGWNSTFSAEGQFDPYSPVGFGGQFGYYRDYCGLYLLGHRYYDPSTGRFVTRDPIGYGGGINLYGFAGNNPVNNQDPEGTQAYGNQTPLLPPSEYTNPAAPIYDGSALEHHDQPSVIAVLSGRVGKSAEAEAEAGAKVVRAPKLRNQHLAGKTHPKTGVPFGENKYPIFTSLRDVILPESLRGPSVSDILQFKYATQDLANALKMRPQPGGRAATGGRPR